MTTRVVPSSPGSKGGRRERAGVSRARRRDRHGRDRVPRVERAGGGSDSRNGLLPYQALANTLPESDQQQFPALRQRLLDAEAERSTPIALARAAVARPAWRRLSVDAFRAGRRHQLFRPASRSVAAGVAARNPGARAGHGGRSGAERRRASSAAGRNDAARLRVDASLRWPSAGRVRAAAAEHRLGRSVREGAQSGLCHQEMIEHDST